MFSTWQHFATIYLAEIAFISSVIYCVHRAQKNRIYSAFWQLLLFRLASDSLIFAAGCARQLQLIDRLHFSHLYFYTYWFSFVIDSVLVLRVLHEMFRHAMRSIPGVQKLGRPVFFWAVAISVILAGAAGISPHSSGMGLIFSAAQTLGRSESVLALCMVTFLAFASHTLGVSFRSRIFGVTFGLAMVATANLVNAALLSHLFNLTVAANLGLEIVNFAAMALWAGYFLQPEPARRLVTMPVTSPLMRWNEVAQTLGNPSGQVAVSYPPSFMNDVFDLVENVMGPASWPQKAVGASRSPGPMAS